MPKKKRSHVIIKKITKDSQSIKDLELQTLKEEKLIESLERKQLQEIERLERLEKEISKNTKINPLRRITSRDVSKSLVGSFFGIVAHFAFALGLEIAEKPDFSMFRATSLFVVSLILGFVFLYTTGYRKIRVHFLSILPLRLLTIFIVSILSILIVLSLFGFIGIHSSFQEVYKQVSVISLPAIMGAITADLIGKND